MKFQEYKQARMSELMSEPWGNLRIPDLTELLQVLPRLQSVLEIGCFKGVSTEFFLLNCGHVTAVDPWPDIEVYREFLARCGHYPHLAICKAKSPAAVEYLRRKFDMCYIDGDHSYEAVRADILACLPLTLGWIAGHDYNGTGVCSGVNAAVDELLGPPQFNFSDGSWATYVDEVTKERLLK